MKAADRKSLEKLSAAINAVLSDSTFLPDGALYGTGLTLEASLEACNDAVHGMLLDDTTAQAGGAMNPNEPKPGTRCECRNPKCAGNVQIPGYSVYPDALKCDKPAVRFVTFDCKRDKFGVPQTKWHRLPMCAACADWHEKGAK